MTKDKLDLIERLLLVHDVGVVAEGGGSSGDGWYGGYAWQALSGEFCWSPWQPPPGTVSAPTPPLPSLIRELVAFARSKL